VQEGFIHTPHRDLMLVDDSPASLLDRLIAYEPSMVDKVAWATRPLKDT
jgi:hypothetical protein